MNNNLIQENDIISFLVERKYKFLRHFLFLSTFFFIIYNTSFPKEYFGFHRYLVIMILYLLLVIKFYINIYFLVPNFFFKGRYITYILLLIILVFLSINIIGYVLKLFFSSYIISDFYKNAHHAKNYYDGIMIIAPMIMTSTTIKLLQKWKKDSLQISELQNLTLKMELNELKNQINPHFLFNMLNNVKALIRKDPEKANIVIMKLSDFLRYQLYENNEEKTPISSEINFLTNFLELEKIRQEKLDIIIETKTNKKTLNSTFIPTNLFTTFVENAIKHSFDIDGKPSYIRLSIEIENKYLIFTCSNSIDQNYIQTNKKHFGLGLPNIKRRLDLLYNDTYYMKIESSKNEYTINLMIPL
ncbi:sensor histidine kinase [Chishuiella sp.]|uniref:sensor histidine kinase n=2 Tax=Chishuiella sp. TaxID=1969467 RepID=UPI0028A993C2|nr:histidine kinase [Chishuiella sp.]